MENLNKLAREFFQGSRSISEHPFSKIVLALTLSCLTGLGQT